MQVSKRLENLRLLMKKYKIDFYLVPTADFHQTEYVSEYFKCRKYISGFSGSAATVVISLEEAVLWTDGRYYLQAENQLENTGITLFKMGLACVPSVSEYLKDKVKPNSKVAFDGRVISMLEGLEYEQIFKDKNIEIESNIDLIAEIWNDRPPIDDNGLYVLEDKYAGESFSSKLKRLRKSMSDLNAQSHLISTLDEIAWLFNLRGSDVAYSPFFLAYLYVTNTEVHLFISQSKITSEIRKFLDQENVILHNYNDIYEFVTEIEDNTRVLIDDSKINYALYNNLNKQAKIIIDNNPMIMFKAMKNKVEIENLRKAQLKDSIAFVKFMYWLKTNVSNNEISEISASDKLDEFRQAQGNYIGASFAPISAYKEHAAMMHYSAKPESQYQLKAEHLLLLDTGANYYEGTTDITRTIVLGEISDEIKTHFSAVAQGMISLSMAKFLYGTKGFNLDILARQPIWNLDIDYKCGTGHGVGYLLNIHEGPTSIRWQVIPSKNETSKLEEGMYLTNEPGIYIDGSHGIRLENELVVQKEIENQFGQFMSFETMTYIPIDLDGIKEDLLEDKQRLFLNMYHKKVYELVQSSLSEEERVWLKEYTREI